MNDFFSRLYELFGYTNAADDLYDLNLYQTAGFLTIAFAGTAILLYYYLFDSPCFVKFINWLVVALGTALLATLTIWYWTNETFFNEGLDYIFADYSNFIIGVFIYALLFFFLFSMAFKWWSPNRRRTPF